MITEEMVDRGLDAFLAVEYSGVGSKRDALRAALKASAAYPQGYNDALRDLRDEFSSLIDEQKI